MSPRQLRLLVSLNEHGSLVRVAELLNVTPPAVTKALQDIEREMDAELFLRGPRGVTPTIYGECMVRHAHNMLAGLAKATAEIKALRIGALGNIVLGVLPAAAPFLAPTGIADLKSKSPMTTVHLREGTIDTLLPDLRLGRIDLMVGTVPPPRVAAGLTVEVLFGDDPMVVVADIGHPLVRRRSLTLEDLMPFPWILPPGGSYPGESIRRLLARKCLPTSSNYVESGSILGNEQLIRQMAAVGFISRHIAEHYGEHGRLRILDLELGALAGPVGAFWVSDQLLSPSTESMLRSLRLAGSIMTQGRRRRDGPVRRRAPRRTSR